MAECANLKRCIFFGDRLKEKKSMTELLQRRYCLGTPEECARYQVSKSGAPVPPDLYPNQQERVPQLLRNA